MLVYGDHRERADPAEWLKRLSQSLGAITMMPAGIARHAKLAGALIDAGQLLQGVVDQGASAAELSDFVHALAACVVVSAGSRFAATAALPSVPQLSLPEQVEIRVPEGFAFYAVYPEAYAEAARRLKLAGPPRVIGIRSIGTTLGAIVAAALDGPRAVTVRPFGHPFAREVELPPEIIEAGAHYIIVDEGPGLSGSSFGAVADWLQGRGVEPDRIAFIPSHAGPLGPRASDRHRSRWQVAQRSPAAFDRTFLEERFGPLEPFTGGGAWQRLKFIGARDGASVLLKFAGLGAIGERKFQLARALHAAALTPEPLEFVHGFLAEQWHAGAEPLGADEKPVDEIGRYIGARARLFPAAQGSGASIDELLIMCRRNIDLALGDSAVRAMDRFDAAALAPRVRRVCTDNKLDRAEWLRLQDGRLLKTDALDHHQGHDLIGCQAVEWDVAGAIEEFELGPADVSRLIGALDQPDQQLLAFYRVAYAAFRLGQSHLGNDRSAAHRYGRSLQHLLQES